MKQYIKCIYLVWRRARNDSRIKIGVIKKKSDQWCYF